MKVICLNQGKFQENTYICLEEKEALIIDPEILFPPFNLICLVFKWSVSI